MWSERDGLANDEQTAGAVWCPSGVGGGRYGARSWTPPISTSGPGRGPAAFRRRWFRGCSNEAVPTWWRRRPDTASGSARWRGQRRWVIGAGRAMRGRCSLRMWQRAGGRPSLLRPGCWRTGAHRFLAPARRALRRGESVSARLLTLWARFGDEAVGKRPSSPRARPSWAARVRVRRRDGRPRRRRGRGIDGGRAGRSPRVGENAAHAWAHDLFRGRCDVGSGGAEAVRISPHRASSEGGGGVGDVSSGGRRGVGLAGVARGGSGGAR